MNGSKKGYKYGTPWPGLTINWSCTSTLYRDHVWQVSFRCLENCGRSLRHKLSITVFSSSLLISLVGLIQNMMNSNEVSLNSSKQQLILPLRYF